MIGRHTYGIMALSYEAHKVFMGNMQIQGCRSLFSFLKKTNTHTFKTWIWHMVIYRYKTEKGNTLYPQQSGYWAAWLKLHMWQNEFMETRKLTLARISMGTSTYCKLGSALPFIQFWLRPCIFFWNLRTILFINQKLSTCWIVQFAEKYRQTINPRNSVHNVFLLYFYYKLS